MSTFRWCLFWGGLTAIVVGTALMLRHWDEPPVPAHGMSPESAIGQVLRTGEPKVDRALSDPSSPLNQSRRRTLAPVYEAEWARYRDQSRTRDRAFRGGLIAYVGGYAAALLCWLTRRERHHGRLPTS